MSGPKSKPTLKPYSGPAGGYGSLRSVAGVLTREKVLLSGALALHHQNKPEGFMCVSCAWGKPAKPHPFEYCENGAKATAWEITRNRADRNFFGRHTLTELEDWLDYDLENAGRLTEPMRWDASTDKYLPVSWEEAFTEIGRELAVLRSDPDQIVFYTSGRAALETSYMFQLFARIYGTNNLPDSSNMCHEASSVALPESIGVPVGTVTLQDFEQADLLMYIAHNPGTSAPRILHQLQEAVKRGARIVGVNPLRERGLERFRNPQKPDEMIALKETRIADTIFQVRVGGDTAFFAGVCKAIIALDDTARAAGDAGPTPREELKSQTTSDGAFSVKAAAANAKNRRFLDHDFIAEHTHGFETFADWCRAQLWDEVERISGLSRDRIEEFAGIYVNANRVIGIYGMGLTQHVGGVSNVQMLVNLLLLRGNVGKGGAGVCAVRGHSNVQGQRTIGITEKPELAPLEKLKELYGFEPPRREGYATVPAIEAMIAGKVKAFIQLGGNVLRAAPECERTESAWRKLRLTVGIATKLNRSHVVHGEISYLLPCLGRTEIDEQATGPQSVSVESSLAHFHGSKGYVKPATAELRSEPAIVAGLARATLGPGGTVPWEDWVGDYSLVRGAIEKTFPATFGGYAKKMFLPGGVPRPLAARERKWNTRTGKANFIVPPRLFAGHGDSHASEDLLQLTTFRSNDQFNTTIYGYHDRFRGVYGTRMVVFMNERDVARLGFEDGQFVDVHTMIGDGVERSVQHMRIVTYDIPTGCVGAYFPEANPLVPLSHRDSKSHTPGYKAVPVRLTRSLAEPSRPA